MSAEIQIRSGEHVLSRIIEGKCIEELGAILEKEKHTYLVYDKKAGLHARKLEGFVNASLRSRRSAYGFSMPELTATRFWSQ